MKKTICLLLTSSVLFASCGGRDAYPVASYIGGDEKKSCMVLKAEMSQLEAEIANKLPKADKTLGNVLLGTAGVFLIVPAFFMDLKGADKIEVQAMQRRYNALSIFVADKDCEISGTAEYAIADNSSDAKVRQKLDKLRQERFGSDSVFTTPETKVSNNSDFKLKRCENCNYSIGKLEEPLFFNGNLVCRECYAKLWR